MKRIDLLTWFRRTLRLPIILVFAVLVFFIYYVYQNAEQLKQLLQISLPFIVLFSTLLIILICIRGISNFFYYRKLGAPLSLSEGIGLAFMNRLANELPSFGGLLAKGGYLKKKHNISYAGYFPATMGLYLCYVSVSGLTGLFVIGLFFFCNDILPSVALLLFFLGMAASCLLLWLPITVPRLPGRWRQLLGNLKMGWGVLAESRLLTAQVLILQILAILVHGCRLLTVFNAFSQDISLAQCVLFSSATVLTRLVSITPGAIGIREGIVATIGGIYGFDFRISAIVIGADRLLGTLVIIIFGGLYTYLLTKGALKQ